VSPVFVAFEVAQVYSRESIPVSHNLERPGEAFVARDTRLISRRLALFWLRLEVVAIYKGAEPPI